MSAGAKSCFILYPPEEAADGWDAPTPLPRASTLRPSAHGPRLQMHDVADEAEPVVSSDESSGGTEDALALAFTWRYHRDWRYVAGWGRWLVLGWHRWRTEDTLAATDLIRSVCRHAAVRAENPKVAAKLASSSTVGGVERCHGRIAACRDHRGVGCRSVAAQHPGRRGRSETGRQRPHDRSDRMTKITTATPGGDCPTWRRFLDEVTGGDVECRPTCSGWWATR